MLFSGNGTVGWSGAAANRAEKLERAHLELPVLSVSRLAADVVDRCQARVGGLGIAVRCGRSARPASGGPAASRPRVSNISFCCAGVMSAPVLELRTILPPSILRR